MQGFPLSPFVIIFVKKVLQLKFGIVTWKEEFMEYVFADSTLVLDNSFLSITVLSSAKPPQPKLIASRK